MTNRIISTLFNWIDFLIHIYIHITATINAVILVAKNTELAASRNGSRNTTYTAEEIILRRRFNTTKAATAAEESTAIKRRKLQQRYSSYCINNSLMSRRQSQHSTENRQDKKNYFKDIPNEILMVVFEFLDQSDLYHCSTVTKNWNNLTTPILWRSPTPTEPILGCLPLFAVIDKKMSVNHQHQKSHISLGFPLHISRYGHAVKSLDLSQIASHVTDCTLRHIANYCPHLTSLNLSHCRLITNEGLRCLTGGGHSSSSITMRNNLKVLVLQDCRQITDIGLSFLQCHGLETLHLGGCNRITDNGIIELVTSSGRSIRRINLSDCSRVTGSTIHAIANMCGPRLEWLDIARTRAIRHQDLAYLIQHCPNITRLNVSMKKPKSFLELRNQLAFTASAAGTTTAQLSHDHHIEELTVLEAIASATAEEFQQQYTTTVAEEDEEEEEIEEHPLNELLELLNRFNIQPTLTAGSAQHQQLLIQQQRSRDCVSNDTIELIAMDLKKLEYLNLSYWNCLNDRAVHMLSTHSHCLTCLNLIGCQSVTRKVLRYLSDLCERKSTCITLSDLMISPTKTNKKSYESASNNSSWVKMTASTSSSSSSSSVSSLSCSEEHESSSITTTRKQHSHGVIKSSSAIWA